MRPRAWSTRPRRPWRTAAYGETPQLVTAGRRELHKRATRQALQEAATRMFEERGYAETTVRDIAEAVGVTERTFFRYFPSKEDLILGEILELFPEFARLVRGRPAGEGPYLAVRNALFHLAAPGWPCCSAACPARCSPTRPGPRSRCCWSWRTA
ncbi:TetR/AcrR family transcriptional regulator [Nonomuraea sp. NPDC050451]|uniref:TetR/AcrR family transcriptional regulator n=1 Tax=Nonomuraea sp. NPDC050451 TaxID=3364364 RepID=UPI0037A5E2FF